MSNKQRILDLYGTGESYDKIAKKLGVSKGTISYHCRRAGLSRRMGVMTAEQVRSVEVIRIKALKRALKERAVAYKGGECSICGYSKCLRALEFHHSNPSEKDFAISKVLSWNRMKKELDKCILLCANCHGEEHERLAQKILTNQNQIKQ